MVKVLIQSVSGAVVGSLLGVAACFLPGLAEGGLPRPSVCVGLGAIAGFLPILIASILHDRQHRAQTRHYDSLLKVVSNPPLELSPESEVNVEGAAVAVLRATIARKDARVKKYKAKLHQIDQVLDRLKRSYHDLYHGAPVMYFSLDSEGAILTFNETLLNTLGFQREHLIGRRYVDVLPAQPPEDPNLPAMPKALREGQKTQWKHKNGSIVDVWIRSSTITDDDGQFARWRCSALDLTERNRLADQLRHRGDELETMNARLRQINHELEDFTHRVSHDLREPLRTLKMYSNLLAQEFSGKFDADQFQSINHMVQASDRLERLIDDLLALSQAGRATGEPQVFNFNETVGTVRRDLSDLIQRRNALISTEGALPDILGDPLRITQLLANLVANGLKYNQSPEPKIVIGQAEPLKTEPDHVVCYVKDNGIGIDPRFHEQIFGIFRRLHLSQDYEGTGAGLAICKTIVAGHGGSIWVESTPGQGATFFFTLPRAPAQDSDDDSPIETNHVVRMPDGTARPPKSNSLRGTKVLLVEDMYEIGTLIKKLGNRSGLQFTWFTTAEEAWKSLQTSVPDFILLDKNLPGMDGIELCRRIRKELQSQVPIALFSQEQRLDDLVQLRKAGANFFISKELLSRPAIWQEKLRELLLKGRAKMQRGQPAVISDQE